MCVRVCARAVSVRASSARRHVRWLTVRQSVLASLTSGSVLCYDRTFASSSSSSSSCCRPCRVLVGVCATDSHVPTILHSPQLPEHRRRLRWNQYERPRGGGKPGSIRRAARSSLVPLRLAPKTPMNYRRNYANDVYACVRSRIGQRACVQAPRSR